jgi:Ca-activated chloride channel family protein
MNLGRWLSRHRWHLLFLALILALAVAGFHAGWRNLFLTPDQRGEWLMDRAQYDKAAQSFLDPMQRGVALFRAGKFKEAAALFGGLDTPEAAYDQGNALVMLGKYDQAVTRYDRALALRPDWPEAQANREIARLRAERMKMQGGDESGGEVAPDEIVFDKTKTDNQKPADEAPAEGAEMNDEAIRASWLKRVQTRPADFLRARFAYQLQEPAGTAAPSSRSGGEAPPP